MQIAADTAIPLIVSASLVIGVVSSLGLRGIRLMLQSETSDDNPETAEVLPDFEEGSVTDSLTPRQKEVVSLILKGHKNQAIAEKLSISPNTVKTHVRNIYSKAGVSSRANLILKITGRLKK